jgi:hypothetical protein
LGALSSETRCWLQRPVTQEQAYHDTGGERAKRPLRPTASAPHSVAALAATRPAWQGERRQVAEGPPGPIEDDCARHHVPLCQDGRPERPVWLVRKRTRGAEPTAAYAISNAPARIPFRTLVWLSGIRWAVAQWCAEGQTALGMAHYEVRQYAGWHPPMWLTRLAHVLLWHVQGRLGEKSASTHGGAAALAMPSRVAPADRYDCRAPRFCGVGPTAQAPGLSRAS